ncbi:hypothetical protein N7468_010681 [Penicillium chermesinum]|uniref:Uncharacterized protein n=1 Tax=Penicillium chermesinum TaxID=63820 RepID=A0A9W9N872_9EURO|nr:uncharacterized protein N7468_010681 [Penicillium chermesinum]KAJ5215002.1 hypothetical protein N7468_010681 [Penicillium chermesinum]
MTVFLQSSNLEEQPLSSEYEIDDGTAEAAAATPRSRTDATMSGARAEPTSVGGDAMSPHSQVDRETAQAAAATPSGSGTDAMMSGALADSTSVRGDDTIPAPVTDAMKSRDSKDEGSWAAAWRMASDMWPSKYWNPFQWGSNPSTDATTSIPLVDVAHSTRPGGFASSAPSASNPPTG